MNNVTQPPTSLYQGYDSFLGQVRNVAVTGSMNPGPAQSSSLVTICTDTTSVLNAINATVSLSGGFADADLAVSASWAESLKLTSTSVAVIVNTIAVTGTNQADAYSFPITLPQTVQEFFNVYGDSFVNQVNLGGQYYAAFIFDSQTSDQQRQIETALHGSAGPLSGSLTAALHEAADATHTTIRIEQQMFGSNSAFPGPGADSIVSFALHFTGSVIDAPTVLAFAVTGYEHVADLPYDDWSAVVSNRNLLGTSSTTPFVDASTALTTLSSQVAAIEQVYASYKYTDDPLFARNVAQIGKDLAGLSELIGEIESNVIGTYATPSLMSLAFGSPQLSYALSPGSAPSDPTAFYDLTAVQIANGVRPAAITLYSGFGIQVVYTDGSQTSHGNTTGTAMGTLSVEDDPISSILVPNLPLVQFVQINTASGKSIGLIPLGFPTKTFNAPPPLIGFCGAMYPPPAPIIAVLTPIAITMSPAVWVNATSSAPATMRRPRPQLPAQAQAQA